MPKMPFFLCLLLIFLGSESFAQEVGDLTGPFVAKSVDFVFDGGSIEFRFRNLHETQLTLVLVNPESSFSKRVKHPYRILATSQPRFEPTEAESLSKEKLEQVLRLLVSSSDKAGLHSSVCGILLAINAGFEPINWGADAVEAIEDGRWLSIFHKKVELRGKAPAIDPFK